ncbi:MAG: hypothetical protein DMF44_11075 [Verrucomicrobia bacterium]|nr:MAG: hypothetical protein DMF44_11075 [Verrucomicrobiota bacterium]
MADSGLQLDLEIALSGGPAKIQPPLFFSPAEGALKRRMTRSKAFLLNPASTCQAYFLLFI